MEQKTITLTRDEFKRGVIDTVSAFIEKIGGEDIKENPMQTMALGMTGTMFGAMLEETLFGPRDEEVADADNQ